MKLSEFRKIFKLATGEMICKHSELEEHIQIRSLGKSTMCIRVVGSDGDFTYYDLLTANRQGWIAKLTLISYCSFKELLDRI